MTTAPINVLIVDDSKVALMLLSHLLEADPRIRVVGAVKDGQAALDFVCGNKPDVVVMDINMPNLDGFEATRLIMEKQPVPIVICSATTDPKEVAVTFRMMEAGAVACVEKPLALERPGFKDLAANLLETVKLMSEVKVVRRWPRLRGVPRPGAPVATRFSRMPLIGVGASTGGPPVIQSILTALGRDFPGAVLIVQHVARGFLPGMTEWLNQTVGMPVHIAAHGVLPEAGHAYLAPDDTHMGVGASGRLVLSATPPENGLRPAVAFLFRSLAEIYL